MKNIKIGVIGLGYVGLPVAIAFSKKYKVFGFDINSKRINEDLKIDLEILKKANILSKSYNKIKILGTGEIKSKINLNVDYVSKSAKEKLEKIGGTISLKNKN